MGNKIKIARANEKDMEYTFRFLDVAEFVFGDEDIESLCEEEPTRILYESIKKESVYNLDLTSEREIRFELLKRLFLDCSGRWIKVVSTAQVMNDQICDKELGYIALEPFLQRAVDMSFFGDIIIKNKIMKTRYRITYGRTCLKVQYKLWWWPFWINSPTMEFENKGQAKRYILYQMSPDEYSTQADIARDID